MNKLQRSLGMAIGSWLIAGTSMAGTSLVQTDAGLLQGKATDSGSAYLGIPFAAPPIGDLRWKAPAPTMAWQGIRTATALAHACKQDGTLPPAGVPNSSEDCLYLNVYVPDAASIGSGTALPVMTWIHGGAYLNGAGSQYDGTQLANAAHAAWNCGYPNAVSDLADLVESFGGAPLMDVIRMGGQSSASGQEAMAMDGAQ